MTKADELWEKYAAEFTDGSESMRKRDFLAALAEYGQAREWQPIETAPRGKTVLVHYKNKLGNGRTMRGCYYLPETLESDTEESGWADEGWYEQSEAYEYLMPLDGDPTHWMPLPAAPAAISREPIP